MKTKRVSVIFFCILVMASLSISIGVAEAEESFSIITEKTEYYEGEIVNVYVQANSLEPGGNITVIYVNVTDTMNNLIVEWDGLSIVLTDTVNLHYVGSFTLEQPGDYIICARAYGCPILLIVWLIIKCILRFLIPEIPLGTAAALIPMLLVLTAKKISKRKEV